MKDWLDVATKTMILSGLKLVIRIVWPWKLTWWIDNKKGKKKKKKKKNVSPLILPTIGAARDFATKKMILSVKTRHLGVQWCNLARSWNYFSKWMSKNDRYRTNNIMGVEWNMIPACCLKPFKAQSLLRKFPRFLLVESAPSGTALEGASVTIADDGFHGMVG